MRTAAQHLERHRLVAARLLASMMEAWPPAVDPTLAWEDSQEQAEAQLMGVMMPARLSPDFRPRRFLHFS